MGLFLGCKYATEARVVKSGLKRSRVILYLHLLSLILVIFAILQLLQKSQYTEICSTLIKSWKKAKAYTLKNIFISPQSPR